jgi:hypothetical protein
MAWNKSVLTLLSAVYKVFTLVSVSAKVSKGDEKSGDVN